MGERSDRVVSWLLEGDPAIRWQVLGGLVEASERQVAKEQARVASQGWGARLLGAQTASGRWAGLYTPKWTSATYTLLLLRAFGLPPGNSVANRGATVLLDEGLSSDDGINFWRPRRRASETCVTGMVLAIAARFASGDRRLDNLVQHLLTQQMPDGGWNCRWPGRATHSSLHSTISVLEGLLEYERSGGRDAMRTRRSRERAHEFLYAHRMFRSHRTGRVIDGKMTRFSFPPQWHYDVLRGLDYLQSSNAAKDARLADAIELVDRRRESDGRWLLQNVYPGHYHFPVETAGKPSRWNTLRALRVLRWWGEDRR